MGSHWGISDSEMVRFGSLKEHSGFQLAGGRIERKRMQYQSGVCCRDPAERRWQLELSGDQDAETERGLCNNLTSKVAEIGVMDCLEVKGKEAGG